ncbi:MAG: EI24 domain-containing protein [Sphingomonas sp.]|nr:EI24 domain-containing protein [Sphingomonas sp.]
MFRALALALTDLGRGRILVIMLQAIAISILIFVLMAGILIWLLTGSDPCALGGMGSCPVGVGGSTIGAISLTLLAAWFLFPAVALTVIATFTDRIAAAVEQQHYPGPAETARPVGLGRGLLLGLKSAGRLILFNLVALPFYVLLLITGVGPFILFVIVNGIAFGRDVAEIAAARHGDPSSRRAWLKATRGQQHSIGVLISALLLVPVVNLLAPVLGAAAGIHLFNGSFWSKAGH